MNVINKVADVADKVASKADQLVPYGKAERLTAGVCMGIPFFLIVAGVEYKDRSWWWFTALTGFFLALPFVITYFAKVIKVKRSNDGLYISLAFSIVLISMYLLFRKAFDIKLLDSISQYVTIQDSFIFGLLLTIGAMLFITNGLIYWDEYKKNKGVAGRWRAYANVILGLALEGVVLFPCTRWGVIHYVCAVSFFVGCAAATILRTKHRPKHKWMDFSVAFIMIMGFVILAGKKWLGWSGPLVEWVNLFGAESVGLWVIGVDFILVSLKRA